ncbi:MAG: prepilin-type N-terminal cleavage/methylation domain-containing protein [Blastocatellia bacterium]|nr:prepilin-type N-terminal cleavage/methylation domain-containing protein [Blastocatellia bacterium]
MKKSFFLRSSGFSIIEILVVLIILSILATLTLLSLNPHRRMVKTEDAASAIYSVMRQARVQAITRRQFYAVVINTAFNDQNIPLSNATLPATTRFLANSVSLIDMGGITTRGDEVITLTKQLPKDVRINVTSELPAVTAFPQPESDFQVHNFATAVPANSYVCYFDPAGRAVNLADGGGKQQYLILQFSADDVNTSKAPELIRAVTLYGSTGGLKAWKYIPGATPRWVTQFN